VSEQLATWREKVFQRHPDLKAQFEQEAKEKYESNSTAERRANVVEETLYSFEGCPSSSEGIFANLRFEINN
jgi:hypothetical protein